MQKCPFARTVLSIIKLSKLRKNKSENNIKQNKWIKPLSGEKKKILKKSHPAYPKNNFVSTKGPNGIQSRVFRSKCHVYASSRRGMHFADVATVQGHRSLSVGGPFGRRRYLSLGGIGPQAERDEFGSSEGAVSTAG